MPTYDYRCQRCGVDFEVWQSMADDTLTVCPVANGPPECVAPGEGPVRKVFSSVGISFKGAGFYKTDHRDAASRDKSEATESSSSSSSSNGSSSEGSKGSSEGSKGSEGSGSSSGTTTSSSD